MKSPWAIPRDSRIRFWDERERDELRAELEREPFERSDELPRPEVGDRGSDELEPEGGYDDAPEPELEGD